MAAIKKEEPMAMNQEKWTDRLKHLQYAHLEMDTYIKRLEEQHASEDLIKDLKKKKLKLKEDIENIKKNYEI